MTDVPRVTFENVWKKFRRGSTHDSLRDLIPSLVQSVVRRRSESELGAKDFWALRDVSFEVQAGKALGIIGRNGAGKSTILKILTRVLAPTRGTYHTVGRVGALIEVAAGFHPDLTGRENVFLQAAVLGMPRGMVDRVFDSIVDFAGVDAFIDTPVKRYSSGMNARLGFAIAAHLEPDVLIIDEVLSVGDTAFQAKCLERMRTFKRDGVAIVFVSHNMHAVSDLCDDALQLSGAVVRRGPAGDVVREYLSSGSRQETFGRGPIQLAALGFSCADGSTAAIIAPGAELRHGLRITAVRDIADCSIVVVVRRSTDNLQVLERWYHFSDLGFDRLEAGQSREIEARFTAHLLRGLYEVQWNVHHHPTARSISFLAPAAMFQVDEDYCRSGVADLELRLTGSA
jgi:lipopolysaccharide transport system ATP-binding protein